MTKNILLHLVLWANILLVSRAQPLHPLGVNISDDGAFVNIVHHTNRYLQVAQYDSLGWPAGDFEMVLADGRPVAEWSNDIDDPERYRIDYSGTYKSSFRGNADITISGSSAQIRNKVYDSASNLTYFDIVVPSPPAANHGFLYAAFRNTQRTAASPLHSGITELKVHRPGYELTTNKIFTDEFLRLLTAAEFVCYRFYAVQNIWDGEPVFPATTQWSNRKTPRDACQIEMKGLNGKLDGWCWEYIVELSNILKKDIWINIHISCDSGYVVNLAKKLQAELDPSINIYVENSNEVWSPTQAAFGPYNQQQATNRGINFNENYAHRTVALSNWFAEVFGKDEINKRIRVVLGAQHGYHGRSDIHLQYINSAFGAPKKYVFATAPALYFGSTQANGDTTAICQGMLQDIENQISNSTYALYRKIHIEKAKQWELPGGCLSYEGGPGLPSGGGKTNLSNQIMANRTRAMKETVKKNYLEGWFDLGGGPAMYFILSSGYNRYGCWGITDDYGKPDRNYKMQAIREILGQPSGIERASSSAEDMCFFYPNPSASDMNLVVNLPASGNISVEIFDNMGQNVFSQHNISATAGKNSISLSIPRQPAGIYAVAVKTESTSFYKKLLMR